MQFTAYLSGLVNDFTTDFHTVIDLAGNFENNHELDQ